MNSITNIIARRRWNYYRPNVLAQTSMLFPLARCKPYVLLGGFKAQTQILVGLLWLFPALGHLFGTCNAVLSIANPKIKI